MYIAICIVIMLFIFLMIIYLNYDRSRFQIEQQYRAVRPEIKKAVSGTRIAEDLRKEKKVRNQIAVLARVCRTPVFEDFYTYFDVHNELAYAHNEKLQKSIFRGLARLMGFREYALFRYSDDIVLTSRQGNRTIHL
ncbi:MAG: hypothetical protein IJJ17_05745 [Parasporobacterium sp.]|nr:hypothetical protein [Parasporobacterium sp.]